MNHYKTAYPLIYTVKVRITIELPINYYYIISVSALIPPRIIDECAPPRSPNWAHRGPVPQRWPSAAACVVSCRHLGGKGMFDGPIGRFGGHCGVLMGFGGPTGGFGGPTGSLVPIMVSLWGLVALQGDLVTLKVFWWPL